MKQTHCSDHHTRVKPDSSIRRKPARQHLDGSVKHFGITTSAPTNTSITQCTGFVNLAGLDQRR